MISRIDGLPAEVAKDRFANLQLEMLHENYIGIYRPVGSFQDACLRAIQFAVANEVTQVCLPLLIHYEKAGSGEYRLGVFWEDDNILIDKTGAVKTLWPRDEGRVKVWLWHRADVRPEIFAV